MLRNVIFCVSLCSFFLVHAQDSLTIHQLLNRIASQQIVSDTFSVQGNFPSYISNQPSFKKNKKDDNVFFAALINFILHQQYENLSLNNRLPADSILAKTKTVFPHFQNKKGRLTYNFWRTDAAFIFPYTFWIGRMKKNTSLPDDMDDTVLSLMAQDADSARAAEAHAVMQMFVNRRINNKTIERKYRSYKAYSVWYGKKFPPQFDVCVLSNILSFVQQYHLTWTPADSASLDVIVQSIKSADYIKKPLLVSPYYGNTSLLIYSFARLMSYANIPELENLKTSLIITAINQFTNTNDLLEKIILSSAILKWGYQPPDINLALNEETIHQIETSNLPFFIGNIPSYFPPLYKRFFTQKSWLLFYHYCPAFNDALLLEYIVLKLNSKT